MSYFSRLTDIVTCNVSDLLAQAENPLSAVRLIILEMEEGVAGAKRSVATATANEARLAKEMEDYRGQVQFWATRAREELAQHQEDQARFALVRKGEIEDLIAALAQQQAAAAATREHLATTQRALEARLAETRRKELELATKAQGAAGSDSGQRPSASSGSGRPAHERSSADFASTLDQARAARVERELESLRRELEQTG